MIKLTFIGLLLLTFTQAISQNAYEYFSSINEHYEEINKDTWNYIKQVSKGANARRIDKKRTELINTLNKAKYNVSQIGAFEGNADLRNETRDYLNLLILTLKNDYQKIVDLEKIAEESYDAMEAYILTKERVSAKTEAAYNSLTVKQSQFAEANNINLVKSDSRISKKLDNADQVMSYYNKIYLLFYKAYWYENQMLKAMEQSNVGDLEQYRATLAEVAQSNMDSLKNIRPFYGDKSLIDACQQLLYFYHGEAVRYMPEQIEFILLQKKMQELNKKMESKPQKKWTQQEINGYNQTINDYNAAVQKFNETSEYLSKFRKKGLDNWNNMTEKYYEEYL